jgi:hypothetical protein
MTAAKSGRIAQPIERHEDPLGQGVPTRLCVNSRINRCADMPETVFATIIRNENSVPFLFAPASVL